MELITTYICKKGDIGVHDNMFGGTMMSLVDDAGASYAAQICDTPRIVTIKIDELIFKRPTFCTGEEIPNGCYFESHIGVIITPERKEDLQEY